jgi:hypothetical protein
MTPADLRTPVETPEERRARTERGAASVEYLAKLYEGGRKSRSRKAKRRSKRRR